MLTTTNPHLGLADWDLGSLFENAGTYAKNVGGSFLMLMGIVGLVWGGTLLIKKLMSSQQDNTSWGKIIMLFIAGGALAVGGFNLVFMVGSGGQKTIEDLGGGTIALGGAFGSLGLADWDLGSLFENAGTYAKNVGGSFLMLMGIVGLVWGGTLLIKKLMSSQQDNTSWGKIIMLFIAGGALAVGGFNLVFMVGSGGQKTIEDLGGGLVHLDVWAQILTGRSLELTA